eukprot:15354971-Ditylum_brightwellii.AAC.1
MMQWRNCLQWIADELSNTYVDKVDLIEFSSPGEVSRGILADVRDAGGKGDYHFDTRSAGVGAGEKGETSSDLCVEG